MTKFSSPDLEVEVDDSGGTPRDFTDYCKAIGGYAPEAETADISTFGLNYRTFQAHINNGGEFTLEGDFDNTAVYGPNALFAGQLGDTRTVRIRWGGTGASLPQSLVEAIIKKYERKAGVGGMTGFTATMQVTGEPNEDNQAP